MEKKEKLFTSLLNGVGDFRRQMAGAGCAVKRSRLSIEPRLCCGRSPKLLVSALGRRRRLSRHSTTRAKIIAVRATSPPPRALARSYTVTEREREFYKSTLPLENKAESISRALTNDSLAFYLEATRLVHSPSGSV